MDVQGGNWNVVWKRPGTRLLKKDMFFLGIGSKLSAKTVITATLMSRSDGVLELGEPDVLVKSERSSSHIQCNLVRGVPMFYFIHSILSSRVRARRSGSRSVEQWPPGELTSAFGRFSGKAQSGL